MTTATQKQTAVIICPGRGTYNKPELGYLQRYHSDKIGFIGMVDNYRHSQGQAPVSTLDASGAFRAATLTSSENASPLIYTCALADFLAIDRGRYDIVAITGNSMGWYLALACAGALSLENGLRMVNTMGALMQHQGLGGQVIYPLVDEQWRYSPEQQANLIRVLDKAATEPDVAVYDSIYLGGLRVLAANDAGVGFLLEKLPPVQERYPFQLYNHAAFHCPLLNHVPGLARRQLSPALIATPELPLVDGRGHIWQPLATDPDALYDYTFGHQVVQPYDFSAAIEVAIKEFAPDKLIVLGPGTTLGAPVAQVLIGDHWQGLAGKDDFVARQRRDPLVLAMGIDAQRALVEK